MACGIGASGGGSGVKTWRDPSPNGTTGWRRAGDRFGGDARGATAVEFGLLGIPVVLTLAAIAAVGFNSLMLASLDRAAQVTARAISTGTVSTAGMTAAAVKTNITCPALLSLFNCSNVFLNVTALTDGQSPSGFYSLVKSDKSGLVQPALDGSKNTFCPGAGAQYVVVQVVYPAPVFAKFLQGANSTTYGGSNVNVLMSSTTFRSEPYTGATPYAGC